MMKKILLVESYEEIRDLLHLELTGKGLSVQTASNGLEAQAYLKSNEVDLVITAYSMPHMNGAELITAINNQFPVLPVVLISMLSPDEMCADFNNYHYLAKPFTITSLFNLVDQIFGSQTA